MFWRPSRLVGHRHQRGDPRSQRPNLPSTSLCTFSEQGCRSRTGDPLQPDSNVDPNDNVTKVEPDASRYPRKNLFQLSVHDLTLLKRFLNDPTRG
jgi:hypothetical protein